MLPTYCPYGALVLLSGSLAFRDIDINIWLLAPKSHWYYYLTANYYAQDDFAYFICYQPFAPTGHWYYYLAP